VPRLKATSTSFSLDESFTPARFTAARKAATRAPAMAYHGLIKRTPTPLVSLRK
jgi:hypothetical protein